MLKRSLTIFRFAFVALATSLLTTAQAQIHQPTVRTQNSQTQQTLISVSPVNSQIVWASGTGGTWLLTTDGGQTWRHGVVQGTQNLQFRDVQGISDKIAYLQSIGNNPGDFRIFKTTDGGVTWHSTTASPSGRPRAASRTAIPSSASSPTSAPPTVNIGRASRTTCRRRFQENSRSPLAEPASPRRET